MTKKARFYTAKNGTKYPLFEADHDQYFTVYKTDKKTAEIGDPHECIEAKGLQRMTGVIEAYVGSGKDAIVVYAGRRKPYALHYVILAKAAKVRDTFDTKGAPATQTLKLSVPTAGRTYAARSILNKRRRSEIKSGNGAPVKPVNKPRENRVARLGLPHRPRAHITKQNVTA